MSVVEFSTKVRSGIIKIPEYMKNRLNGKNVHISIDWENEAISNFDIQQIESIIVLMKEKKVFENITDPSEWQKKLRNEWE
jgi:hypothetical protein